jgi:hypothetical protein
VIADDVEFLDPKGGPSPGQFRIHSG